MNVLEDESQSPFGDLGLLNHDAFQFDPLPIDSVLPLSCSEANDDYYLYLLNGDESGGTVERFRIENEDVASKILSMSLDELLSESSGGYVEPALVAPSGNAVNDSVTETETETEEEENGGASPMRPFITPVAQKRLARTARKPSPLPTGFERRIVPGTDEHERALVLSVREFNFLVKSRGVSRVEKLALQQERRRQNNRNASEAYRRGKRARKSELASEVPARLREKTQSSSDSVCDKPSPWNLEDVKQTDLCDEDPLMSMLAF